MKMPRRMLQGFFVPIALLAAWGAVTLTFAASQTPGEAYSRLKTEYMQALQIPENDKKIEVLRQCIDGFEKLVKTDPDEKSADKYFYLIGQCYHRITDTNHNPRDLKSAIQSYRTVVQKFPASPLADDAQYLIGILYLADDPGQAYLEFVKVTLFSPKGDMRAKAVKKIEVLKKRLECGLKSQDPTTPGAESAHEKQENGAAGRKRRSASCPSPARLDRIQHWSGGDYTRVVLYTSAPVGHQVNTIAADPETKRPARIYLNLKDCLIDPKMQTEIRVKDEFLQQIHAEQCDATQARVVLEAQGIGSYRVFALADPSRLIVDMRGSQQQAAALVPPAAPKVELPKGKMSSLPSLAQQLGLDIKRIVLDPGHGGKDKGAVSRSGLCEKNITLELAFLLKKRLEEETGCEVVLTRTKDVYLSLEERTAIANAKKADIFISIHTNANEDRSYHGIETYFLNLSKDKESARVAAFENATSTKRISDLEAILHDLMLNTKIDESARLAKEVQSLLVKALKTRYNNVRDLGTKQAPFYVLLGAEMPSILIETAFITNETEEHRLKDKAFQALLTDGMTHGVKSYIQHIKNLANAGEKR
jgi:N-acetylmuramoyl-L-alanine amidase